MSRPAKPWLRSSDGCWWITLKGKKVNLHVKGANNEAQAWAAYQRLLTGQTLQPVANQNALLALLSSLLTGTAVTSTTPVVTVRQVIDDYLSHQSGLESAVAEQYRRFLLPFADRYGQLPATALTPALVEEYSRSPVPTSKSKRKSKPKWSDSTRSKFIATVVAAFRKAEHRRLIDRSPLTGMKRPPIRSRAEEVLISAEEFDRLYEAATPQFQPLLRLVYLTGCRPGEASQLTAADVDLVKGVAHIRKHKTANKGHSRTLVLVPSAVELLKPITTQRPTGPLFRTRVGKQWNWRSSGQAMRAAAKRAGLKGKVLYGLRHSLATEALEEGASDSIVAKAMGHSVRTLHSNYNHIRERKAVREMMSKVRK